MQAQNTPFRVGDATITKLPEITLEKADIGALFPDGDPAALIADADRWGSPSFDRERGVLRQSIHAWLVKTPTHTVLVDTATGNAKQRPTMPVLHQLDEPFLERLHQAGVAPDAVDLVLLTHIHADHVGWNTVLRDGRWQPTFPNARHVFSAREYAYNAALTEGAAQAATMRQQAGLGDAVRQPAPGVFDDSIEPIVDAGLDRRIVIDDTDVESFVFHATPGHSIDHASISFTSGGETALFWGDVMHHPLQFLHPELNSVFCEFPEAAREARQRAMRYAADHEALVFTTHFADSSAGRVSRRPDGFDWHFRGGETA